MFKTVQTCQTLKRDILSGALRPDQALTVATLTVRHGFGRAPLRASLSRLEGECHMTLVRNRGHRVVAASLDELQDVRRARLTVKTPLLRDWIRKSDDDWLKRVLPSHCVLSRSRFLVHRHAPARRHKRQDVLGHASLSDPRSDAALLTTLHSALATEHYTRLMNAVLDRDEPCAVDLLQDHIGTAQGVPSSDGPT